MINLENFANTAINLGVESYEGVSIYSRGEIYDYAGDLFDNFAEDGEFFSWDDVRCAMTSIFDDDYDFDSEFVVFLERVYRLFRNQGMFNPSRSNPRAYRSRWESPVVSKVSKTFDVNPFTQLVGLEIEVEDRNVSSHAVSSEFTEEGITKWDCVHDGSLDCGSEFRLRQISNGDSLLSEISKFCRKMKQKGYGIDSSCGVHMHIDFADSNLSQLKKLIRFYSRYEKYIYEVVGTERSERRYSQSLGHKYDTNMFRFAPLTDAMTAVNLKEFKEKFYESTNYDELEHYKYYNGRYSGFNVHSIFLNGTLELRYLRGTLNERYITSWVLFNLSVIDMFVNDTNQSMRDIERYERILGNAPSRKEFLMWLTPFGKSQYRKLQRSFLYETRKK